MRDSFLNSTSHTYIDFSTLNRCGEFTPNSQGFFFCCCYSTLHTKQLWPTFISVHIDCELFEG